MPVTPTYPGVYIQEIPSGVRTIVGVSTSITAFIGRARRGPVDQAVTIFSYGDFERTFGGLHVDDPMGYAVRDFFLNGGSQAIIVRLFHTTEGAAAAPIAVGTLKLEPVSPGAWANQLRISVNSPASQAVADRFGLPLADLFNLIILDKTTGVTEKHLNVSVKDSPRRLDRVLEAESQLIRCAGNWLSPVPGIPADKTSDPLSGLDKALEDKEAALKLANKALKALPSSATDAEKTAAQTAVTTAMTAQTGAQTALKAAMTATDSPALTASDYEGDEAQKTGLFALEDADLFNILCIPPDVRDGDVLDGVNPVALAYCVKRRAFLLVDPPKDWKNRQDLISHAANKLTDLDLSGEMARNAAVYYPRVLQSDPLRDNQTSSFVPCGVIAGLMARTDSSRGVWKAPAGIDAGLNGVQGLEVMLTDGENGALNQVGINCLRTFPVYGRVAWGARTLRGADQAADEYKYVPVRRTALFIEESLFRGLKWVVFEPNDEPLWAQVRLNVGAFMHNLFRQGAFQGTTPRDAYFVKCDKETTTQNDINLGIVNIVVGFAPLKPAEFVIVKLQQMAGQIEV
jgi:uncharacterized protein